RFGTAPALDRQWKQWAGRFGTMVVLLGLLVLAWPGWLNARSDDDRWTRRVAWRVRADPSWSKAARELHALHQSWREEGVAEESARGFNFVPEIADYCAWFAPEEKCFIDERSFYWPETLSSFLQVRRALDPAKSQDTESGRKGSRGAFAW